MPPQSAEMAALSLLVMKSEVSGWDWKQSS